MFLTKPKERFSSYLQQPIEVKIQIREAKEPFQDLKQFLKKEAELLPSS